MIFLVFCAKYDECALRWEWNRPRVHRRMPKSDRGRERERKCSKGRIVTLGDRALEKERERAVKLGGSKEYCRY